MFGSVTSTDNIWVFGSVAALDGYSTSAVVDDWAALPPGDRAPFALP
jgi:hypothetical protein